MDNPQLDPQYYVDKIESLFPGIWSQIDKNQNVNADAGLYLNVMGICRLKRSNETFHSGYLETLRKEYDLLKDSMFIDPALIKSNLNSSLQIISIEDWTLRVFASWRTTKLTYHFDGSLFSELMKTPLKDAPPASIFERLPVPCLCLTWINNDITDESVSSILDNSNNPSGVMVYSDKEQLALLPIYKDTRILGNNFGLNSGLYKPLFGVFKIPSTATSIEDVVNDYIHDLDEIGENSFKSSKSLYSSEEKFEKNLEEFLSARSEYTLENKARLKEFWSGILSNVLYLCSKEPDLSNHKPVKPQSMRMGIHKRIIAPKQTTNVNVGFRIGSIFRKEYAANKKSEKQNTGNTVQPHIRCAHWHNYWEGPKDSQILTLKWLSPILVNSNRSEQLASTVHPVRRSNLSM